MHYYTGIIENWEEPIIFITEAEKGTPKLRRTPVLISSANIHPLSMRRSQARLSHMYKIMYKLTDFPNVPIDLRSFHYNSRSNNSMAIIPFQCRSSQFLNSFFPKTAAQWNSLSKSMVSQNSITSFKHAIINLT